MINPFEMLEEMPDEVFKHWRAYRLLQNPEYRGQISWASMEETERIAAQESAALSVIRSGKAIAERRNGS